MNYHIGVVIEATASASRETIEKASFKAFGWDDGDERADHLSGGFHGVIAGAEPGMFTVVVERVLPDDIDVITDGTEGEPLAGALLRQFNREIGWRAESNSDPSHTERLASAGLRVVGTKIMGGEEAIKEAEAEDWPEKIAASRRTDDLKGFARTLAERGHPAERDWSPEVVDAYERVVARSLRKRLSRLARLKGKELVGELEATLKYAKAVTSEKGS